MRHWCEKYLGGSYSQEYDCYHWARKIYYEQYGIDVPFLDLSKLTNKINNIKKAMIGQAHCGFKSVIDPIEGDMAYTSRPCGSRPEHIGIVVFVGNKFHMLHAIPTNGVVLSDKRNLRLRHLTLMGFWRYSNVDIA